MTITKKKKTTAAPVATPAAPALPATLSAAIRVEVAGLAFTADAALGGNTAPINTRSFWSVYRRERDAMKSAGLRIFKNHAGDWFLNIGGDQDKISKVKGPKKSPARARAGGAVSAGSGDVADALELIDASIAALEAARRLLLKK